MSQRLIILGCAITYCLCFPLISVDAKLLGYWAFNSKKDLGVDSSPNRNHGEAKGNGTAEWIAKGKVGGGLKLKDGWLEIPHDDSLNVKDQITLMCWAQFSGEGDPFGGTGRDQSLVWKNGPFATNKRFWTSYALRVWRRHTKFGSFGFDANLAGGRSAVADPDFPDAGDADKVWYHIAGVADGTEIRIYTDGKEKKAVAQRGEFQATDLPLTIGYDLRPGLLAGREYFYGIIDEVVIVDTALTEAQINGAMDLGNKGKSLEGFNPIFAVEPEGKLATQWGEIKARK